MIVLFIVLLFIAVLAVLDYTQGFKVSLDASVDELDGIYLVVKALYPLVRVEVKVEDSVPYLLIYIFKLKLVQRRVTVQRRAGGAMGGKRLLQSAGVSGVTVSASYGLTDPFAEGLASVALRAAANFVSMSSKVEKIDLFPDFLARNDYIMLIADANFSLGHTILNYLKRRN